MFSAATIAALTPFLLGLTQASPAPVRSHLNMFPPSLLVPNFPIPLLSPHPDTSPAPVQAQDAPTNVKILDESTSAVVTLGNGLDYNFACNPTNDAFCYKRWWDYYRYCHPYDRKCYRDCDTYDSYQGQCKNWNSAYGKCYDKCYYDQDNCDKYKDCYKDGYGDDDSCYQKKHKETYCAPEYDDNYNGDCHHEPPKDYCKPYDYDCHRKQPDYGKPDYGKPDYGKPDYGKPDYGKPVDDGKYHDEYKCYPNKDKDCYPGYPEYPEYPEYHHGDDDQYPQEPTSYVTVKFFNNKKGLLYEAKVWPTGEELYTGESICCLRH